MISELILEKSRGDTSEESIKKAVGQMEPPAKLGKALRPDYKGAENGLMLFNRTMVNFAAPAFLMLAAFVVFRLYPTTEYIAYAIVAVVAGLSAYYSHRAFYKLRYNLLAVILPSFLLIYYPARAALKSGGNFISELFSYSNHVVLTLIVIILIVYPSIVFVLYAREYTHFIYKKFYMSALYGIFAVMIALFGLYAYNLKLEYDAEATELIVKISSLYSVYNTDEQPDMELTVTVKTAESLEQKYADIYIPSSKQTSGSLSELLTCFSLYSQDYSYLVKRYHSAFDPNNENRIFDISAFDEFIESTMHKTALAVEKASATSSFRALVQLEIDSRNILDELVVFLSGAYNEWIFSSQ